MDFAVLVETLLPVLGQKGVDALQEQITELMEDSNEPWKKAVLALVANSIEHYGPEGITVATKTIKKLLDGRDPDLKWIELDVASDLLATMQNAEADRKSKAMDYLGKVGKIVGPILGGILKGLIV